MLTKTGLSSFACAQRQDVRDRVSMSAMALNMQLQLCGSPTLGSELMSAPHLV